MVNFLLGIPLVFLFLVVVPLLDRGTCKVLHDQAQTIRINDVVTVVTTCVFNNGNSVNL